ncbi:MAG: type II secretion system F family protein [Terriglobales bacterium]|jgi:type IV pilus assembly protein PilC
MADYLIKVADERGHVSEKLESARSEAEVRERFLQQGLLVVNVKQRGLVVGGKVAMSRRRKIKLASFVVFNQQMVTLVRAGLPILNALDLLTRQQKDEYFRSVLQDVRERVKSGQLLSQAFEQQGVMPKLYTTTLLAGEKSGNLEEVLSRFVHFQRLSLSFRKKLMASLIYPMVLVSMVVLTLTFLVTFVVPRFADLYSGLGAELPQLTEIMLSIGLAAQKYFLVFLAVIILIGFGVVRWFRTATGGLRVDRMRLALPIIGPIWLKYQVAMFTRMLSTLLAGGLPLVTSLETAGASIQSREIALAVSAAGQRVREGQPLARSLEEGTKFPELAIEMIEVGESTGALPQMLTSVAEFYEEDVENALTAALSLIEPAILVVMAIVVAFVLISLYLPIFKLGASGTLG